MKHAPLYVAAHDLAVEVARGGGVAGARAVGAAFDLVEAVALAVTFPAGRAVQLGRADEAVVRLRVALRIAVELGERSEGAALVLRHLDDLFLFGDRRGELRDARDAAVAWLRDERGLVVKDPEAPLRPCAGRLDALGQTIRRRGVEALPRALRRVRARVRGLLADRGRQRLARSTASTAGVWLFGA